jgi:MinD superfamily P-loop ATPase
VDHAKCTGCGRCAEVCCYHAIACIKGRVLVFAEMCHGCGGCALACPEHAISEVEHEIGRVETGHANGVAFIGGILKVGTAMSPPLIRAVKQDMPRDGVTIIDAPPGTSCPMIAAVRDSDFVILVTEPTPFGLHDLTLAVDTIRQIELPFGVVINRCDVGDARVHQYCAREGIPILLEIPDSRRVAEAYSRGEMLIEAMPELRPLFSALWQTIHRISQENDTKNKVRNEHANL